MSDKKEPLFSDPKKQEKLEEAIRLGFIIRSEENGIQSYALTPRGQQQWILEKLTGR